MAVFRTRRAVADKWELHCRLREGVQPHRSHQKLQATGDYDLGTGIHLVLMWL